jgi:hypothetical protein
MTISQGITLVGKGAIMSNLYAMPDRMQRKAINRALKPAAAILRKQAKSMAPKGVTGNLKRSIRVRALRGMPPAISVHPTYKIAPHKHLVHEGTKERTRKSIGGKFAYLGPNTSEATRSQPARSRAIRFSPTHGRSSSRGYLRAWSRICGRSRSRRSCAVARRGCSYG